MKLEEFTGVTDFPLTPEVRQLGFSRVYICFNSNREQLLLIDRMGIETDTLE
jgi:hypothetical protein